MKKIKSKKLVLHRDTVRNLSDKELAEVAGGRSCSATCGTQDDMCLCRICGW